MFILGISAFYHDSAAALVQDGTIVAAAQEERFTRRKHDSEFPGRAIEYCLNCAKIDLAKVDHVVFYDKPFLKFERLLETYLAFAPHGLASFYKSVPIWLHEKLFLRRMLNRLLRILAPGFDAEKLLFSEHHLSHAASAFYPSPFRNAAVLTMDGVGEWATTSVAIGDRNNLSIVREIHFPHSIGLLYSAFTYYLGFKVNSGEYKVMGLAPYGEPKYADLIRNRLVDIKPDGTFRLDQNYFDYCTGLTMTNDRFDEAFGGPPRKPDDPLTQRDMNLAASIQAVTDEIVLRLARSIALQTGERNLCLAGGVALNCVANGRVLRDKCFDRIWVQPAAGDAGGALGAALAAYYLHRGQSRTVAAHDSMSGSYLGPQFEDSDIAKRLAAAGAVFETLEDGPLLDRTVNALIEGKAVGWFQGRMEFGPRALGARSIIADPRNPAMQKTLNMKVKYRESFRPFAPAVLREDVSVWFELEGDSPYMLMVADVLDQHRVKVPAGCEQASGIERLNAVRSIIPAVTHLDYSARVQTVHRETNPRFHELLSRFKVRTGCPVLVNTSFNVRGEPIVGTPEDALRCFLGTEIDLLVIGNQLLLKECQPAELRSDYAASFEPD